MKTVLIALACSAALAPAASAKAPPKLTDAQIIAAANQAASDLAEPIDADRSRCSRVSRTRGECDLYVRRDGEPGNGAGGSVPPGECIAHVRIVRRKSRVLYGIDLARGPHMWGYCGVRS